MYEPSPDYGFSAVGKRPFEPRPDYPATSRPQYQQQMQQQPQMSPQQQMHQQQQMQPQLLLQQMQQMQIYEQQQQYLHPQQYQQQNHQVQNHQNQQEINTHTDHVAAPKYPPHHYVPTIPPKLVSLPLFDSDRLHNTDQRTTSDHIRQIGVPVLPFLQNQKAGYDQYEIVPPSQNKAFLRHLQNHKNFDTMKNLRTSNNCPICQMFLSEEESHNGGFNNQRAPAPRLQDSIPEEPDFDLLPQHPPYPTDQQHDFPQPQAYPKANQHQQYNQQQQNGAQHSQDIFSGLQDNSRHRTRVHVKDVFGEPLGEQHPQPHSRIMIPAPDYNKEMRVKEEGASTRKNDKPSTKEEVKKPEERKTSVTEERKSSTQSKQSKDEKKKEEPKKQVKEDKEKKEKKVVEVRVTKDYNRKGQGDVSVKKGHLVEIIESNGKWSRVRTADGETGFVPNKYLNIKS